MLKPIILDQSVEDAAPEVTPQKEPKVRLLRKKITKQPAELNTDVKPKRAKRKQPQPKPKATQPKVQPINTGAKYDTGKERFDLMQPEFELEMARVLTYGADTYGENSWQGVSDAVRRYTAALRRHTNAMMRGEIYDAVTGRTHASHIAINAMFLHYFQTKKNEW